MCVTIPGALADYITASNPTDPALNATLDAAHRGRGRTLVITPTSTAVLHTISAYAEALLINRALHGPAAIRAARTWIARAGHTPATTEQADTAGTWRAEWISARATSPEPTLFDIEPDAEQGALFA